jgi:hypothetical protein
VIGTDSGGEDNAFYRRSENGLIVQGGKTLGLKETIPLGEAVIHSVTNPLDQITAAITFMAATSSPCGAANGTRARLRNAL